MIVSSDNIRTPLPVHTPLQGTTSVPLSDPRLLCATQLLLVFTSFQMTIDEQLERNDYAHGNSNTTILIIPTVLLSAIKCIG